jgi:hypothetical protein
MGTDYSWGFTTGDGVWGSAQLIETDNTGDAGSPRIAVDPSGNALAVWDQFEGPSGNIWATRFTPTTGWGTAQPIGTAYVPHISIGNLFRRPRPQVAVGPSGDALAVWDQYDGTSYNSWANRFTPTSGWGTAQIIRTNTAGTSSPQVAVDPSGDALAVWSQFGGTRINIWATRFTPTTGWGTAQPIGTNNTGDASSPQVAVDPNGNGLAVWNQFDGTRFTIWATRFTPTTGWSTAQLIGTETGDAASAQVVVDSSGNALATWSQFDGTRRSIWANRFTPATGWSAAQRIGTNTSEGAHSPHVAVDPSGNALAVWYQFDGGRSNVWANRFTPSTGWGTAQLAETDNTGDASSPQVAVDPNGNALAVWSHHPDFTRSTIWANRFTPTTGWGTAQPIETNNAVGAFLSPQVSVDSSGNTLAVWNQFDGTRSNLLANRFE